MPWQRARAPCEGTGHYQVGGRGQPSGPGGLCPPPLRLWDFIQKRGRSHGTDAFQAPKGWEYLDLALSREL